MLHEEVVARLRHAARGRKSPPGTRVPEDLCQPSGSPEPVAEALKVMAAEGLVVLLPNRGARAARLTSRTSRTCSRCARPRSRRGRAGLRPHHG